MLPRTEIFFTYWFLDLKSELVFIGDEGTTEAQGPSRRQGLETGAKVRLLDWLTFTGDFTYTPKAEFTQTGFAVPLAPIWTARADLTARLPFGLSSSVEIRYLGDRWADEFRHADRPRLTLLSSTTRYRYKDFEAFLSMENLTNVDWRDAQFYFTSRLPGEPAQGVNDIYTSDPLLHSGVAWFDVGDRRRYMGLDMAPSATLVAAPGPQAFLSSACTPDAPRRPPPPAERSASVISRRRPHAFSRPSAVALHDRAFVRPSARLAGLRARTRHRPALKRRCVAAILAVSSPAHADQPRGSTHGGRLGIGAPDSPPAAPRVPGPCASARCEARHEVAGRHVGEGPRK